MVLICASLSSCSHPDLARSTACYGISEPDASLRASDDLAAILDRGSRWTGLREDVARSLVPTDAETFKYDRGDGYSHVKIAFTAGGADGTLYAFVHEDCSIEWSPQFR